LTGSFISAAFAIPPLVAGVLIMALGLAVLVRERSSFISFWFWLMTVVAGGWLLCYAGIYSAPNEQAALWWTKVQAMVVVFIPALVYIFTLAVIKQFREYWAYAYIVFVTSCVACSSIPWSNMFVVGVHHYPWGYYAKYGPLSIPFLLFFFTMMAASLRLFWTEYQGATSQKHRNRLRAFLVAFVIAYAGSVDFIAAYGIPVYPFGYLPIFGFVMLAAVTIWRYRLEDITPAFVARQILKTMADALLVLDRDGIVRLVNPATCRLLGYSEDDLLGKPLWAMGGDFLPREKLQKALRIGVVQRHKTPFTDSTGQSMLLDVSILTPFKQ